ncbi:MAG: sulfatase-like hydrolase/transferase [Rhodobacter sp.]|nr:sulfatase-like hydrolase/transferase [Rhodobacter sp.]
MTNLLILISDEHRRDAIGCIGHPQVQTPHLDALAARGTLFTNAYTPSPMCVPARAAVACGDHVHRIRYWDSATPYDGARRSWMHDLRDAGWRTASIGKLHFRSPADDNGFSEEILPMHVMGDGWTVGLIRDALPDYPAAAELAADVGTGASSYTDYDRAITDAAVAWLAAPERQAQPWAAFVSLVSPHYPLVAPERFAALYDPADMPLPVGWREVPAHDELQNLAGFFDYDRYFDETRMRTAKTAYFGLVSFMDNCVGRVLAALEASGQAGDTLVLYVSDHGEMLGDHGLWTKQVMYEASAGVPMILSGPGAPKGQVCRTGASLLDIAATARDLAALPSGDLPGRPLAALAGAPDDPDRVILSEYHDGGSTTGAFMVRWDRWKLVHYQGFPPQLFDLAEDPHELRDIASDRPPVCAEGMERLRAICDPAEVNARCFADQAERIAALGGRAACLAAAAFNHTPAPA